MESDSIPRETTGAHRTNDASVYGQPLDGVVHSPKDRETGLGNDTVVSASSLKRRSLAVEMELHQKRPATCDSSDRLREVVSTVFTDLSHDGCDVTSGLAGAQCVIGGSSGVAASSTSGISPSSTTDLGHFGLRSSPRGMNTSGQSSVTGTSPGSTDLGQSPFHMVNVTAMGTSTGIDMGTSRGSSDMDSDMGLGEDDHMGTSRGSSDVDSDVNPGSVHRGCMEYSPVVERDTSICVDQSSIGTQKSVCTTQHTSRDRVECGMAEPLNFPDCYRSNNRGELPHVPIRDYEDDGPGHGGVPSEAESISMSVPHCGGLELLESYPATNDYVGLSQIDNPVCMSQLDNTAILDTMLGPTRSNDESMSNVLSDSVGMRGQSDTMTSIEIRRLSNGSVNLASDCGDVKRQIVVDENLTNTILKDLICSICLEYFYFPVTLCCGHTFCRYCIGHLRLAGKFCPLCRKEVGRPPSVNTIMWNLVKALKIRKRMPLPPPPRDVLVEEEKLWWEEHCLKPFMSLPLFLRIMFGDIVQTPPFFDDVCTCVVDYFDRHSTWSKAKWVFTIEDSHVLRRLVGFDSNDLEATSTRLHVWVENYLSNNPHLCVSSDDPYPFIFKVYSDINHKIDGITFNAMNIHHRLPWDAGRHIKSLLHLPHSSVSLSHLVFVPCGQGGIGLLDCGSTIGTMVKLQGQRTLQDGDRIHVGDKHEVDVILSDDSGDMSYDNFRWDPVKKEVVDMTSPDSANWDLSSLEPIDCPLKLRIYADTQEERDVWTCPKGVILGRGPQTQSAFKKLSITTQNGYISREHCLIYYDGSRDPGQRWILRDMSTLGTFLKLKPFQQPVPIEPGFIFKVGQCKVEVCNANDVMSRRTPNSPAALILSQLIHNHFSNVAASMPPEHLEGANVVQSSSLQPEV
ncbi:zinc finger protein [Babesia ovis]|uniref:E3 ubiquitin-protein ligase CHFR n=1 Tax=Babesia ovis TaxID=5869 RepID=A0A9W5WVV8_BABOV|nr:zinc finger protein [Babesia ovis]